MNRGECPKCGSSNIYKQSDGIRPRDEWVMLDSHWGKLEVRNPTPVDTYLCIDCGYFENYVTDKDKLSKVAQIWDKVG
ncbi:MAG: hypothetical protein GY832_36865 [Chloroflexi bacterium]|nr:hypothetical protein [Chloroflexota bacterium]